MFFCVYEGLKEPLKLDSSFFSWHCPQLLILGLVHFAWRCVDRGSSGVHLVK